jgi:hypothetical protein
MRASTGKLLMASTIWVLRDRMWVVLLVEPLPGPYPCPGYS